ncbi:uncharacterized protein LOC113852667 [Abrus precatorius]|uniref:Uncharacterized protein LOC113852667 n=1 Tax=Abrus precatorius TaxID=3816 RepID=A0A8B8K6Q6_ABRPR|nr:uncharacterized protein LOC113852667 [Abrus precatorius]
MLKFLSRSVSPKLVYHPWPWLSPKFLCTHSKQNSFTASYLIETCGFSPHRAESLSKHMNFETHEKPDTVIEFFKTLGFSQTKALRIVRSVPDILRTNPNKHLYQRIEFLKSKGFSDSDIRNIISNFPIILCRSLKREIIPCFGYFSNMFQSQHKFMKTVVRYSGILCDFAKVSGLNLQTLREEGVPESLVIRFVEYYPRTLKSSPKKFKESVLEVKELGFNPLRMQFIVAAHLKVGLSRSTWARKECVYRKWGWSNDDILAAFRVHPFCMATSESKIEDIMDFLVNKLGFKASDAARYPVVLSMSLGKRITPRGSVFLFLKSKGLMKMKEMSLRAIFQFNEKLFLDKFIYCHDKEADELLKLYKAKLTLAR